MLKYDAATYAKNMLNKTTLPQQGSVPPKNSKYILLVERDLILRNFSPYFSHEDIKTLNLIDHKPIYLGCDQDEVPYFALNPKNISSFKTEKIDIKELPVKNILLEQELGLVAQALSLINWNNTHQFCCNCGHKTHSICHGWQRDCHNCHKLHFPRIDPVIIMLVTNGEETLLGAGNDFTAKRYSCLAGFMEPGETIEAAARRELYEEAGIVAQEIKYMVSQPWPFPFTLMIGLHITTDDKEIVIDKTELKDITWVNKSKIRQALEENPKIEFTLPPKVAIAHTLLHNWAYN